MPGNSLLSAEKDKAILSGMALSFEQ